MEQTLMTEGSSAGICILSKYLVSLCRKKYTLSKFE